MGLKSGKRIISSVEVNSYWQEGGLGRPTSVCRSFS